jgi:hypothetical protein
MLAGLRENAAENGIRPVTLVNEEEIGKNGRKTCFFPEQLLACCLSEIHARGSTAQ